MKVLWFTNTPSLYDQGKHYYHGGGWIESLEELMHGLNNIELAISFLHETDEERKKVGRTVYYPIKKISAFSNPFKAVLKKWNGSIGHPSIKEKLLAIVNDFKPNIIHIFGTEEVFATIQEYTDIPVVIHIQGLINPYLNTYFGVNQSRWNYLFDFKYLKNNLIGNSPAFTAKKMFNQAKREVGYLNKAKFVMGRTEWDKLVTNIYNSKITYFHVNEVLRKAFYNKSLQKPKANTEVLQIVSTLSPTVYKGIDVILKTAKLLTDYTGIKFSWQLVGINNNCKLLKHYEKEFHLAHEQINIQCVGKKNSEELITLLSESNLFIHPSYIDNSPNSVCEAQIIGVPVIACNVGGVSSIIEHEKTGILVPSNGAYELVQYIKTYKQNSEKFRSITIDAKIRAEERHNKTSILDDLINAYNQIIIQYAKSDTLHAKSTEVNQN